MNHTALGGLTMAADLFVKSTLVVSIGWLAGRILRRNSAAVRHLIWVATLTLLLAIPVLEVAAPKLIIFTVTPTKAERLAPSTSVAPADLADASLLVSDPTNSEEAIQAIDSGHETPTITPAIIDSTMAAWTAAMCWAIGFAIVTIYALIGWISLRRLRSDRYVLPADLQDSGGQNEVVVRISREGRPPSALTWGLFRPVILLPKAAEEWPENRLRTVLMHEFEHVRRRDASTQLIGVASCALYWFNPVVWMAAKASRAEAEAATDDAVIRAGIRPSAYAHTLLEVAEEIGHHSRFQTSAGVAFMKKSKIEDRVRAILDNRVRRGINRNDKIVALTIAIAVLGPLAAVRAAAVKPFAELPGSGEPTVTVSAFPTVKVQTEAEKKAAAMHNRHLLALENQLRTRQMQLAKEQSKLINLQRSIEKLSLQIAKPNSGLAMKEEAARKLRAQIDQGRVQLNAARSSVVAKAKLLADKDRAAEESTLVAQQAQELARESSQKKIEQVLIEQSAAREANAKALSAQDELRSVVAERKGAIDKFKELKAKEKASRDMGVVMRAKELALQEGQLAKMRANKMSGDAAARKAVRDLTLEMLSKVDAMKLQQRSEVMKLKLELASPKVKGDAQKLKRLELEREMLLQKLKAIEQEIDKTKK